MFYSDRRMLSRCFFPHFSDAKRMRNCMSLANREHLQQYAHKLDSYMCCMSLAKGDETHHAPQRIVSFPGCMSLALPKGSFFLPLLKGQNSSDLPSGLALSLRPYNRPERFPFPGKIHCEISYSILNVGTGIDAATPASLITIAYSPGSVTSAGMVII